MKTLLLGILTLATIAIAVFCGYLYMQNQALLQRVEDAQKVPQPPVVIQQETNPNQGNDQPQVVINNPPAENPAPSERPPIIFTPGGAFSANTKSEIQTKIIDPFIDYYATDQYFKVASIEVSENTQASKTTYPYLFSAISKTGGNQGFVIGKTIDWWIPECMGPCPLTEAFKAKYPEIVKKLAP